MAEVFLPAINPVDDSRVNPNGGAAPAGGFLGDGDLASNDGDASGWEGWNTTNVVPDPGLDEFSYDLDLAGLPAGAVLSGYQFEMTLRLLSESSPQTYAEPVMNGNWSLSSGQFFSKSWALGEDYFNYHTYVSDLKTVPADMAAQIAAGTARVAFSVTMRNTNVTDGPSPVRCTMAGLRVFYTVSEPVEAPGFIASRRRRPPVRQLQRGDAHGMSTASRALQHASTQGSLRNIGFD